MSKDAWMICCGWLYVLTNSSRQSHTWNMAIDTAKYNSQAQVYGFTGITQLKIVTQRWTNDRPSAQGIARLYRPKALGTLVWEELSGPSLAWGQYIIHVRMRMTWLCTEIQNRCEAWPQYMLSTVIRTDSYYSIENWEPYYMYKGQKPFILPGQ